MQINISTSYFGNIKNVKNPVSIARSEPKWFQDSNIFASYKKLAPSWRLLGKAKSGKITFPEYIRLYHQTVLDNLAPHLVLQELIAFFGEEMTLLCWEKRSDICHRRLVAIWLMQYNDLQIPELLI